MADSVLDFAGLDAAASAADASATAADGPERTTAAGWPVLRGRPAPIAGVAEPVA